MSVTCDLPNFSRCRSDTKKMCFALIQCNHDGPSVNCWNNLWRLNSNYDNIWTAFWNLKLSIDVSLIVQYSKVTVLRLTHNILHCVQHYFTQKWTHCSEIMRRLKNEENGGAHN